MATTAHPVAESAVGRYNTGLGRPALVATATAKRTWAGVPPSLPFGGTCLGSARGTKGKIVAISSSSASHRLREIAADLSSIPAFGKVQIVPEVKVDSGRAFLEAIDLGTFSGQEYRKLQEVVQQQKMGGYTAGWEGALWDEVVKCLSQGEYDEFTCSAPACKFIAQKIATEATRLEADAKRKQGEDETADGPWSKADGPQQWAKKFGFSTDTLMRRFEDGTIRHKKLSSKSYRIHVDDVPK